MRPSHPTIHFLCAALLGVFGGGCGEDTGRARLEINACDYKASLIQFCHVGEGLTVGRETDEDEDARGTQLFFSI